MLRITVVLSLCTFYLGVLASGDSILRVVQISDVQLGFTMSHSGEITGKTDSSLRYADEIFFAEAIKQINSLSPAADVIINTGDLVNNPDDTEQWKKFAGLSSRFKAPVYNVMGNHDGWTNEGIRAFADRTGKNDFYSFKTHDCLFIILNSWYLKYPEKNMELAAKQKSFAEETLAGDNSAFRVLVMHFPAFIKTGDEKDEYFNLPLKERQWLLNLAGNNKVKLVLSGHSHRNIINHSGDSLTFITTGPVSKPLGNNDDNTTSQRGFRIIDINTVNGTFSHRFISLTDGIASHQPVEPANGNFSFAFLGDMHFDKPQHHDMNWVLSTHPGDTSQITGYCRRTATLLPSLHGTIQGLAENRTIDMVVNTGDFTEGLCGSYNLACSQLSDFITFARSYIRIPYLLAKGNHDITGPGADSAYNNIVLPFLSSQTGANIQKTMYTYIYRNTAFFFYDSYNPASLDWLEEQMRIYKDMPLKFVVLHEPVVPINARSKWTEFSKPSEAVMQDRLLNLLGNNKAIVLAGHLHCYGLVLRKTNNGAFVQLSGSSVPDKDSKSVENYLEGKKYYGKQLIALEPGFSPADKSERLSILKSGKSRIKHFEYAEVQGYIIVNVTGKGVTADIYSGTGHDKWKTVDLSGLLN